MQILKVCVSFGFRSYYNTTLVYVLVGEKSRTKGVIV